MDLISGSQGVNSQTLQLSDRARGNFGNTVRWMLGRLDQGPVGLDFLREVNRQLDPQHFHAGRTRAETGYQAALVTLTSQADNVSPQEITRRAPGLEKMLREATAGGLSRAQAIQAAADVHMEIWRPHHFSDANGRTARLMADHVLMRNGLPPAHHGGRPLIVPDMDLHQVVDLEHKPAAAREYFRRAYAEGVARSEKSLGLRPGQRFQVDPAGIAAAQPRFTGPADSALRALKGLGGGALGVLTGLGITALLTGGDGASLKSAIWPLIAGAAGAWFAASVPGGAVLKLLASTLAGFAGAELVSDWGRWDRGTLASIVAGTLVTSACFLLPGGVLVRALVGTLAAALASHLARSAVTRGEVQVLGVRLAGRGS